MAHLLISAISLECGYAASAIRERIYCAPADVGVPMAAILLSTGSPGTEGTLGGLVEQGRYLRRHLRHARHLGEICSNDPGCAGGPTRFSEPDCLNKTREGGSLCGVIRLVDGSWSSADHCPPSSRTRLLIHQRWRPTRTWLG
ncbi:MAG TPA: DUF1998 domain-containing protein [Thermoanaerobaculia bacterium]|nr:DUF1998 domain-containing protein [Thermoanaerobaculia bacterium]